MTVPFEGGCACQAIRYKVNAEPLFVGHCHCKDCQKITGAQMATIAGVPSDAVTIGKGEAKVYITKGDSGNDVFRAFCAECGSTLYSTCEVMPGLHFIEAGSLDDPSWLRPTSHIYTSSAQPWAHIPADMEQHAKMPPAG
ncbi:MAG: aldehyde-activating protein [Burkholderiales bacterium]|nr:aldehyde-activating protein [Burkholderiales bacterium]